MEFLLSGIIVLALAWREIGQCKYEISPVVLSRWKKEFLERASEVFKKGPSESEKELEQSKEHIVELERKVGQLTYEVDWLKKIHTNPRIRLEEKMR